MKNKYDILDKVFGDNDPCNLPEDTILSELILDCMEKYAIIKSEETFEHTLDKVVHLLMDNHPLGVMEVKNQIVHIKFEDIKSTI